MNWCSRLLRKCDDVEKRKHMLGGRSQVSAGLGISLGCWNSWCSWLSGKIETGYRVPSRLLAHARRASPQEVLAAAVLGMLDEALVGTLLGLSAPLEQGAGTPFSPAQDHTSFFSSGCRKT